MRAPIIKISALITGILIVGGTFLAVFTGPTHGNNETHKSSSFNDKASNDTPVETLKTLTTEISAVEQQNQKIIENNRALTDEDKTKLAAFKSEVLIQVQQQIQKIQSDFSELKNNDHQLNFPIKKNDDQEDVKVETDPSSGITWTWVSDMQNSDASSEASVKNKFHPDLDFAHLIKQGENKTKELNKKIDNSNTVAVNNNDPLVNLQHFDDAKKTKPSTPYYTIPVNATLTGAIAMQPIIGRVPINGKVPDPYTFKVIIGPKNLAANGIDMPEDLQGIVASGIAEGDLLGSCARGDIRSMTFVFTDGRISTTQSKDNETLGTIAAANGNPCIQGSFHTDAPLFLGVTAGLAGLQGYGNALSQSQLNHAMTPDGNSISSLLGSANKYAFGQGFSSAATASQKWWDDRVQSSFDFVYVPNVDLKTGEKLKLNINVTQEVAIDYDSQKRKVFYSHDQDKIASDLD